MSLVCCLYYYVQQNLVGGGRAAGSDRVRSLNGPGLAAAARLAHFELEGTHLPLVCLHRRDLRRALRRVARLVLRGARVDRLDDVMGVDLRDDLARVDL